MTTRSIARPLLLAGNNANADYSVKHYKGRFNAYQRTYVITIKESALTYAYAQLVLEYLLGDLKRFSKGTEHEVSNNGHSEPNADPCSPA